MSNDQDLHNSKPADYPSSGEIQNLDYSSGNSGNDGSGSAPWKMWNNEASSFLRQSNGESNIAGSELMKKFAKFNPQKTNYGEWDKIIIIIHGLFFVPGLVMKLPGRPGVATEYKFNVDELRQLAKTAHQIEDAGTWSF